MLASTAFAQHRGPVRAAIGDVLPTSMPNILGTSTMFNPPDDLWNHGEGFDRAGLAPGTPPADRGGLHGFDDGSGLLAGDIRVTSPASPSGSQPGWKVETYLDAGLFFRVEVGTSLHRLVGYLWPQELSAPAGGGFEAETAFEIFAPTSFAAPKTIIVIAIHPTITSGTHLWDYSGDFVDPSHVDAYQSGLRLYTNLGATAYWGNRDVVPIDRFAAESNAEYNIISGYIVPPTNQGHLTLTAQRVLQFERVVQMLFDPAQSPVALPPGAPTGPFPVVLTGGSNGGQVATLLTTMFPDRFHAAYSTKFPMSMRRHLGEEAIWTYIASTQGFLSSGEGFGLQYIFPYTSFYRMLGTDWARGGAYHLWKNGAAKRPLYMLAADEDYTWTGEDLSLVKNGLLAAGERQGQATASGPTSTSDPFYWSVTDKECHDNSAEFEIPTSLATPGGFGPVSKDQAMGVLAILPLAVSEAENEPLTAAQRPALPAPPAGSMAGQLDGPPSSEFDPFHHVLYRESTSERRAGLTSTSLLTEDLGFWRKQHGLGTWLGAGTSLVVDPQNRIYVGGADGVVTRLTKDATTGALIIDPSSQQAERCRTGAGTDADGPFSLGYAVTALDVDATHLVVGTFGRLYVYETNNLGTPAGTPFDLPWIEQRPGQVAIVEGMFGGEEKQVAYITWLGEFVVRDLQTMACVARFSAPSMFRFVIEGDTSTGAGGEVFSKPIWFSSARGHLVQAVVEQGPNGGKLEVQQASAHFGAAGPLLLTSDGQGPRLAYYSGSSSQLGQGLYMYDLSTTPAFVPTDHVAAPPSGTLLHRAGLGYTQANQHGGVGLVELAGGEITEHVALESGHVLYLPGGTAPDKWNTVPSGLSPIRIPSISYAIAIAAADLDNIDGKDLVIATQNGQVTWLPGSVLRDASGVALDGFSSDVLGNEWFGDGRASANPGKNSTSSISAAWGIAFGPDEAGGTLDRVQVIDQCARRWSLNPGDGTPTYLHTVPMETWRFDQTSELEAAFPAPKPFRGLGYLGGVTGSDLINSTSPSLTSVVDAGWEAGAPGFGVAEQRLLFLNQFHCAVAGPVPNDPTHNRVSPSFTDHLHIPNAEWLGYRNFSHTQIFAHGYLPFAYGGDVLAPSSGGPIRAFYWGGNPPTMILARDPVTGLLVDRPGGTAIDVLRGISIGTSPPSIGVWGTSTWGSTPRPMPIGTSEQAHVRTADTNESLNSQSVRVATWNSASPVVRVLAGTTGGSLQLFDGTANINSASVAGVFLDESEDFGYGGCALAVDDALGNGEPVIAFGTHYAHAGATNTGFAPTADMVASLHFFGLDDGVGARTQLVTDEPIVFDGQGTWPKLFGICGVAFIDLDDEATDGVDPELVVTTLNGDLVVLNLVGSNGLVYADAVLYHQVFDGALGASNSIVVDDESNPATLYIAGSMGTRKFTWSGQ